MVEPIKGIMCKVSLEVPAESCLGWHPGVVENLVLQVSETGWVLIQQSCTVNPYVVGAEKASMSGRSRR